MSIQIILPSEIVSAILGDLAKRRAVINDVSPKGNRNKVGLIYFTLKIKTLKRIFIVF